jgi:hypothetical protein
MPIRCGRGPHFHETINDVRACYNGEDVNETAVTAPVSTVVMEEAPATDKQIAFLSSLADQKLPKADANITKAAATSGHWGKRSISEEINRLKELPKRPADSATHSAREHIVMATESHEDGRTPVDLEAGMYRMDETIYKVQRNVVQGDGSRAYAKRLTEQNECRICGEWVDTHNAKSPESSKLTHKFSPKWRFEYEQGAIHKLRPEMRMSLEEAKEFGKVYGTCCVCGRTLTNETSIEEGIGPVCGGRV